MLDRLFMLLIFYHQSPVNEAVVCDLKRKVIQESSIVIEDVLWLLDSLRDALFFFSLCYQSGKKLENGSLKSTLPTHQASLKP